MITPNRVILDTIENSGLTIGQYADLTNNISKALIEEMKKNNVVIMEVYGKLEFRNFVK